MQDPSTAHVSRVGAAFDRTDDWLEMVRELAPSGFDEDRDAACIHHNGTVLYASPTVSRILGLDASEPIIGQSVAEWFHPRDRARVATTLSLSARKAETLATTATLAAKGGRTAIIQLTACHACGATRPFEILYLRSLRLGALADGEDERFMATRQATMADDTRRISVLICDDEARLGTLTAGLLSEYGFDPITVGTGEDAIAAIAKADPMIDIVLLDVNLSHGKPARDVLATVANAGSGVRVVLTSGLAEEDVDPGLMQHPSVSGYVAKPYGVDQLVQSIKKALGGSGS